jgi:hypothetical protein
MQLGIELAASIQSDYYTRQTGLELANHRFHFPPKTVLLMWISKAHRRKIRQSKHQERLAELYEFFRDLSFATLGVQQ